MYAHACMHAYACKKYMHVLQNTCMHKTCHTQLYVIPMHGCTIDIIYCLTDYMPYSEGITQGKLQCSPYAYNTWYNIHMYRCMSTIVHTNQNLLICELNDFQVLLFFLNILLGIPCRCAPYRCSLTLYMVDQICVSVRISIHG